MSQQINLFNPAFLLQKKVFSAAAGGPALLLLLAGTLSLAYLAEVKLAAMARFAAATNSQLEKKQLLLASAVAQFPAKKKSAELDARIAEQEAQLKAMQGVSALLQRGDIGNTHGYADYFKAFARQHVSGLWLTGVAINGAGVDIEVRGRTTAAPLVPHFFSRLSTEPVMRGKVFDGLQINQPMQTVVKGKDADAVDVEQPAPYVEFTWVSGNAGGTGGRGK